MPFQILSLSGGGYLGLYTICVLAALEERIGAPLATRFDLIAGTSVGGIIAVGIANEVPADAIKAAFERNGTSIFSARQAPATAIGKLADVFLRSLLSPKYDPPKPRCGRIHYDGDFHIDVPIYHLDPDADERTLAAANGWEVSDPKALYLPTAASSYLNDVTTSSPPGEHPSTLCIPQNCDAVKAGWRAVLASSASHSTNPRLSAPPRKRLSCFQ